MLMVDCNSGHKVMKICEIQDRYWECRLVREGGFVSVYEFCKEVGIEEAVFYKSFTSLEAIEAEYWSSTVRMTVETLNSDSEFLSYTLEQKLLAFFYTYISGLQPYRSRLIVSFPSVGGMSKLLGMRKEFLEFADASVKAAVELGEIADRKKLTEMYGAGLFEQFRMVLEFYKRDQSSGFEDTDAFIEKSVRLGIAVATTNAFDAGLDFARFMVGRLPRVR